MTPSPGPLDVYLHENGVVITRAQLQVPGRSLDWRSITKVYFKQTRSLWTSLVGDEPAFHLVVETKEKPEPETVLETHNSALVFRIQAAINQAAQTEHPAD